MSDRPAANPVLLLGRDAEDAAVLLDREGIECRICPDFAALCDAAGEAAGCVMATVEALARGDLRILRQRLDLQPSWSALPFIVLTRGGAGNRRALEQLRLPERLENVVFLERPLAVLGLLSAVRSAVHSRARQRLIAIYVAEQITAGAQRKSEERFRNMVDSVPALIWITNVTGRVIFANLHHDYLFGRTADAIIADGWVSVVLPEDRDEYSATFAAAFQARTPFRTEARFRDKAGAIRWLLCEGVPRLDDKGQFRGYTSCSVDVTEARLASDELEHLAARLSVARDAAERASRAKSRFVAGMSHELRTPLNGILGYTQLLRMEGGLNAMQSRRVDSMLEAGKHLLQMITRVLDLSEIEAEHVELEVVKVDVEAVAKACLDLVRPAAGAKALTLALTVAAGAPPALVTDPTRLRQVLINLLGNAVKFTATGSVELRLRPAARGAPLRIEIADTGPGISPEQRQRLFQDFERLDSALHTSVEGAGLGLALSARLAALMGGRLGHEDNPGGGSVFWLELPLHPGAAAIDPAPATAMAGTVADGPPSVLRVLVVDDVAMNRDIAAAFLRSAGHAATCVEGGAEAIASVMSTDFDVVLMDVRMPKMDGLEATRRIRMLADPRGQVPIVALTAQAFAEQIAECRDAGMDSHVGKPFDPKMLIDAVEHAAAARPRRAGSAGFQVPQAALSATAEFTAGRPVSASP